jgi:hypothetical protein
LKPSTFTSAALTACIALGQAGCVPDHRRPALEPAPPASPLATFAVPDAELPNPLVIIAYGDMRFTDASETAASVPAARRALVAKVASDQPAAVFLNGDVPWHGIAADYAVFKDETSAWRDRQLRVYPALGNHEFSRCETADCLNLWWGAFPQLQGRRWYSVALGSKVLGIALDSDAPLLPGSEQAMWLERQVDALSPQVRYVLVVMHHPPVADLAEGELASHNPRANEVALAQYLARVAPASHAAFLVCAGHTHNYERFARGGVTYLVSGGGGAHPYPVDRGPDDLYQSPDFPNFHYIRLTMRDDHMDVEMIRLQDPASAAPREWQTRDRFTLNPRP